MIYLNLGRREVGKTTLACYLISKSGSRVIFDPRGLMPATLRATTPDEIDNGFYAIERGRIADLVITPEGDVQACFDQACATVKRYLRGGRQDIAFLIDELRFVEDVDGADLNWILRCATRDSVVVVFTAHRPVDVNVNIRAISDVWCIFQTTQENDLKVIAERCAPAVAQKVARLPPRHFIAWNDAAGKMTAHTDPERWYVPLRPQSAALAEREPSELDDLRGESIGHTNGRFDFTEE